MSSKCQYPEDKLKKKLKSEKRVENEDVMDGKTNREWFEEKGKNLIDILWNRRYSKNNN